MQRIETPHGPAQVAIQEAKSPTGTLVLTHGAGGGIDARDLQVLSTALPDQGYSVHLVEMPWRVAGKKIAPRPPIMDECYLAVMKGLDLQDPIIGGRSAGARSACRIADTVGAAAVLTLSFPLHPPGKPENSRVDELTQVATPLLVVQGERDPFGRPEEFPDDIALSVVPAADHGMKVPKSAPLTQEMALAVIAESTLEWLTNLSAVG